MSRHPHQLALTAPPIGVAYTDALREALYRAGVAQLKAEVREREEAPLTLPDGTQLPARIARRIHHYDAARCEYVLTNGTRVPEPRD